MQKWAAFISIAIVALAGTASATTTIEVKLDTSMENGFIGTVTQGTGPLSGGESVAGTAWTSDDGSKHYCLKGVIREGQTTGPHNPDSCFAVGMSPAEGSTDKVTFVVLDQYLDGFTPNTDQTGFK